MCLFVNFETFFRTLLLKSTSAKRLFYVQVSEFEPPDTVKSYFTGAFRAFCTRSRSSHSKAFIYLKSQKTVCEGVNVMKLRDAQRLVSTCKLTKKPRSHILLHAFCLHFLRLHHNYFFRRGFESLRAQYLAGNVSGK